MNSSISLYQWQEEGIENWVRNGYRGIAQVATGAGKTIFALAAAERLRDRLSAHTVSGSMSAPPLSIKIVVPKIFLAFQWKKELSDFLHVPEQAIGLFYGARKNDPALPYMIYVLNSARYQLAKHILQDLDAGKQPMLILDEVHHFGSTENAHIFDYLKRVNADQVFTLGLSATPDAEHLSDVIIPAVGSIFLRLDIEGAIHSKIAASYETYRIAVELSGLERAEYAAFSEQIARIRAQLVRAIQRETGRSAHRRNDVDSARAFIDFSPRQLGRLIQAGGATGDLAFRLKILYMKRKNILLLAEARVACGEVLAHLLPKGSKAIIFTERIQTANELFERLSLTFPGKIARYHSKMDLPGKKQALETYQSGQSPLLICCRALDEGLNVPETDVGIILSSGNGLRQRIQRTGRIVRKTKEEKIKRIYYLYARDTVDAPELFPAPLPEDETQKDKNLLKPELSFDSAALCIRNPKYERAAAFALAALTLRGATEKQILSAQANFTKGILRSEYLLPENALRLLSEEAAREEKNYLNAMILLARADAEIRESQEPTDAKAGGDCIFPTP